MALMRNPRGQMMRRVATWSLVADVAVGLFFGIIFGFTVGLILFVIGLVVTGVFFYNAAQVLRTRR